MHTSTINYFCVVASVVADGGSVMALHDDDRHNSTAANQLTGEFTDDLICIMGPVNVSCILAYSYMHGLRVHCGLYVRLTL